MDFDEPNRTGRLRKTGRGELSTRQQDAIYEYRLSCADQFEGLPYRSELDDAMAEFAHSQKIHYVQEVPVVLEPGDFPAELNDAFYFPDAPTIEAMTLDVSKDKDGHQFMQGSFYVGRIPFSVEPGFPGVAISTESNDGSVLTYKTSQETLFELLGAMYARNAARMLEKLHKQSLELSQDEDSDILEIPFTTITSDDVKAVAREFIGKGTWADTTGLFEKLANETGKSSFSTYSIFTPSDPAVESVSTERALLATKTETIHGSIEQSEVTLDINWFLGNRNTEIIGTTAHNGSEKFLTPAPSAIVQPIDYDVESFAFMKELEAATAKERKEVGVSTDTPLEKRFTPEDTEWLVLVSIFMTTVQPYLDRHAINYEF